jgi:hypothetical protein
MRRPVPAVPALGLLLASAASAVEWGEVRLTGVPAGAYVYVDGRRTSAVNGIVRQPPGWHEVQVERSAKGGVEASRRLLEFRSGQSVAARVRLLPVASVSYCCRRRSRTSRSSAGAWYGRAFACRGVTCS